MFFVYVVSTKLLQISLPVDDCSVQQLSAGDTISVSGNIGHKNHKQQRPQSKRWACRCHPFVLTLLIALTSPQMEGSDNHK